MTFCYQLTPNSDNTKARLEEYDGNHNALWFSNYYSSGQWFLYNGKNPTYQNKVFIIIKENDGKFHLYNTTQQIIGGRIVYTKTGPSLINTGSGLLC